MKLLRFVLVGRVSRGERNQDPESQLIPLRAAVARLGGIVAKEIARKVSAWDDQEAAKLQAEVFQVIEAGEADVVGIWAWDRFDRGGIANAFLLIDRLERHLGASVYSLQEPFLSTATASPQTRELMLTLSAWTAKWESERKSERLVAKVRSKRQASAALGQRGRWGKGQLATPAEVQRIHDLTAQGQSARRIAAETGLSKSQVDRIRRGETSASVEATDAQ